MKIELIIKSNTNQYEFNGGDSAAWVINENLMDQEINFNDKDIKISFFRLLNS